MVREFFYFEEKGGKEMATVDKLEIDGIVRDIQDKSLTETVNTLSLDYQETKNKVTDIEGDVAELQEIVGESAVTSVNGKSGAVTLDAEDVGAAPANHVDVTGGENIKGHVKVTTDFSNATENDVVPSAPAVKTAVNNLQQAINSKSTVPTNHASSDITYGIGTSSNYGHVKVDNTYDKESPEAADGVAASAYALQSAYNELKQRPVGVQSVNGKTGSNVTLNASDVGAAPSNHASPTAGEASPVYGGGTSTQFGHVSLTDVYNNPNTDAETDGAANSKAASAYAVQAMYKEIMESGAGGGTYVEANPTLSGGEEALTAIQIGSEKYAIEGGGGGVSDYTELENKPSINNVELDGNKTSSDLGLAPASHTHTSSDVSGLAGVATSGSYNDLSNKPTKLSDFTDDLISIGNVEPSASSEVEIFIDESEDYASGIPSVVQEQTGAITVLDGRATAVPNICVRKGDVCMIQFGVNNANTYSTDPFGVVPEFARPHTKRYLNGALRIPNGTYYPAFFIIDTNGNIYTEWNSGNKDTVYLCGTYLI